MPKTITFTSKHRNLRITRRPHVEVGTPTGAWRTTEHPVRYQFTDHGGAGVLEITEGQDLLSDGAPVLDKDGYALRDAHGFPRFEQQDALAFLRGLPEYNNPHVVGGFTEVGAEPDRIPPAEPRIKEIFEAFAAMDRAALEAFAAEEQAAAYERPAVDAALETAFAQLEAAEQALRSDDHPVTAAPGGTAENGGDDLDAIEKMEDLKLVGGALGLSFTPGTSKVQAREQIREARAAQAAV